MIKQLRDRLRPRQGFAHFFHLGISALLPILVYIFVRLDLDGVALALILLSKWRIFAIQPRHWLAHVRTNAVDIIFSLSILTFMTSVTSMSVQLLWMLAYEAWILYIKPGSSPLLVTLQALIAQSTGLVALFIASDEIGLSVYIIGAAVIAYFSARHFFGSFEEPHLYTYSWVWTLFVASLVWILSHWLLFYGPIAQPALLTGIIGYSTAALYYLAETDKLSKMIQRQVIFVMVALVAVVLILSDWGSRTF